MNVQGKHWRTIWPGADGESVGIIDQMRLPHEFATVRLATIRVTPEGSPAANPAFDVTPARLVTGLITERGIAPATADGLRRLFPEKSAGV